MILKKVFLVLTLLLLSFTFLPSKSADYYVGNKSTKVYHMPGCGYVKKIKANNKVIFDSIKKASSAGYSPCKKCKPNI